MSRKEFWWAARAVAVLVLVSGAGALAVAQAPMPDHFSGIVNDYTAAHNSAGNVVGPYEIRGKWNIRIDRRTGTADFSAYVTMEFSDYWIDLTSTANADDPSTRGAHTHTISMTDVAISSDTSNCPKYSPATSGGFMLMGPAHVTGNGDTAPFEKKSGPSELQVCVTGGPALPYSNITLAFADKSPAAGHFGSQAIHGAVRPPRADDADVQDGH